MVFLLAIAFIFSWVGHAYIWISILSNFYGRPWPKWLLRLWRRITAIVLVSFPALFWTILQHDHLNYSLNDFRTNGFWGHAVVVYAAICLFFGAGVFPCITLARLLRKPPGSVIAEQIRLIDLWPVLGKDLIGDNKRASLTRLPGNGVFRVEITDLTLALPDLPPEWQGLTVLLLSDLHFHGTPSRLYFERILDELESGPPSDLVCLLGDYVDSDSHHEWIQPLLCRLNAREAKLAILGNHDKLHNPERVRRELAAIGCRVLGNSWQEITIRGVRCVAVGHEGPWFTPGPDLSAAPAGLFRLCLSHTPDNFYWGVANSVGLMLCGHVHGGAIRLPLIGPIFVPSVYGRRFDSGVFAEKETTMVVSRGISGKEPVRFRCNPQVIRITLRSSVRFQHGLPKGEQAGI